MQNDLRSVFVIEKSCNVIELASELSKPCEGKELYRWCSWKFWQKKRHMRLFFYYCSAEQNAFFTLDLHMCFDRFLLAFESRDLSQAYKSIKECFLSQTEWWVVKVLFPWTFLSAWDRSRDSKAKRNLSKHMWRTLLSLLGYSTIVLAQACTAL